MVQRKGRARGGDQEQARYQVTYFIHINHNMALCFFLLVSDMIQLDLLSVIS